MNEQARPDFNRAYDDQCKATRSAEALIADLEKVVNAQRAQIDELARQLKKCKATKDT